MKRMQVRQMNIRSKRTAMMTETLDNIRRSTFIYIRNRTCFLILYDSSIKLYGWEYAFMRKITEVRNEELAQLKTIGLTIVRSSLPLP
jgi:ATP-binding cassette, subfamily C (CFTR/MRP), member 1